MHKANQPPFIKRFLLLLLPLSLFVLLSVSCTTDKLVRLRQQVEADMQRVDLQNATIVDLQNLVRAGKLTYKELTQMYLRRIELFDANTISLNSVRALNPQALAEAEQRDREVAANPYLAQGMFGIPVLIKDNINVVGMPTTAGSVALANNYTPTNAHLADRLMDAGAVILGKVNLTEFGNYIAIGMTGGWSSLGGQVRHPYRPVTLTGDTITLNPSGSSAGSGTAAAAALAAVTIGTETSGSILSPSFTNSVVGIKPTVGLVSRSGVIPIALSQDISGPMVRNVTDAAILLTAIMGFDPNDESTAKIEQAEMTHVDFTQSLRLGGLSGKRVGLVGIPPEGNVAYAPFQKAIQVLRDAGVEIVTNPDGTALTYPNPDNPGTNPRIWASSVLDFEFARDLPVYLATLSADFPIRTLQDILDFNNAYMEHSPEAFPFGQAILERCAALDLETSLEQYLADRERDLRLSGDYGIDYLLEKHELEALISASNVGITTLVMGARAGYPTVSIPLANPNGTAYPINLHFTGTAFSEAILIELAYVVEQATNFRIPPGLAEKSELGNVIGIAKELSAERRAHFQHIFDLAFAVYQCNFSIQAEVDKAVAALRVVL